MPVMKRPSKPISGNTPVDTPAEVPKKAFIESVVDSEYIPSSALLTYVAGSEWTGVFYQQVSSDAGNASPQDTDVTNVHQQYRKIHNVVIKVETPLTAAQVQESREFEVTGEGHLTPPLVPAPGDMFIADIGDGRSGIFTIGNVTRLSIYKDSVFRLSYTLTDFATSVLVEDLESKVIDERHYHEDFLQHGMDPVLHSTQLQRVMDFKEAILELIEYHYAEFFSTEHKTFILPTEEVTYDPYLVKAYNALMSNAQLGNRPRPLVLDCTGSAGKLVSTVWDSVLKVDRDLLHMASQMSRLVPTSDFISNPSFGSVAFSGAQFVLWGKFEPTQREALGNTTAELLREGAGDLVFDETAYTGSAAEMVYAIDIDPYYIFSRPFYLEDPETMSNFELELNKYLNREAMNPIHLAEFVSGCKEWEPIQRFYLIPILVAMLRIAIREV